MEPPKNHPRQLTPEERKRRHEAEQRHQAEEAGCFGLLGGWALSRKHGRNFSAEEAAHTDAPFMCTVCMSDAVLRKCTEKKDHYAHHARLSPVIPAGETALHQGCLDEILQALKLRFPAGNWAKNRPVAAKPEKKLGAVVPDISGRLGGPKDQPLVIEAQVSSLSITGIITRSKEYTKRNIPILWIVPLKEDLGDTPFRPRLYERYLHSMYHGRVYYWQPGFGVHLLPVHYGVAERHIALSEWYDTEAQEERSAGGYDKPYKVIKRPVTAPKVDIASQFYRLNREGFRPWNERKTVPPLAIWKDKLPDWWDKSEEEVFRSRFKEDNLPRERQKTRKPPQPPADYSHYGP